MIVAAATLGVTSSATAQDAEDDEVIVTGSRLVKQNIVAVSPVTTVSQEDFAVRGVIGVEELVNELPQVFAGQGANIGNGASGTATVNLRGLGAARTLVMIDGKRMGPGSPNAIPPDLNQIPAALISDVDILTGGAGAVYGSDALAGVVNFKMNREFEGIRLDVNMSTYQHSNNNDGIQDLLSRSGNLIDTATGSGFDGFAQDWTLAFGTDFAEGRGNVTGYLGYRHQNEITQANRDYSACAFGGGTSDATADPGVRCVGSFTTPLGTFTDNTFSRYFFTLDESSPNEFRPVDFGNDTFNFNPTNHFIRPDERITGGFFAEYEVSEKDTAYADLMIMDDRSVAQIAFSGNFFVTSEVSCDNPFLSAQQQSIICDTSSFSAAELDRFNEFNVAPLTFGRRNVEGDPRQDDLRHTSIRGVGGIRGDMRMGDWTYDVYGSYSNTHFAENYLNEIHITRAQNALYATTDADGNVVCRADLVSDPNCVPINWFEIGGVTPDALNYVQGSGFQDGNVTQVVMQAFTSGSVDELNFFGSSRAPQVGIGLEYRADEYELRTDEAFESGLLAGQGGPSIGLDGDFDSYEVFGEVELPIAEDQPGMEELTLNGAYRYADNSLSGGSHSYSGGLIWQPMSAIRMRGQYQRAVRAANAVELFRATSIGLFNFPGGDPCSGAAPAFTAAQCANTGVSAAQYGNIVANPAGQYNALFGGNTALEPEKSDTYTIGAVLQPGGGLDGLLLSVDYFDITVNDFVGTVPAIESVNQCAQTGDPFFCSLVNRDPASGSLWTNQNGFVTATNLNTGSLKTSGIDINADYGFDIGSKGSIDLSVVGTYLLSLDTKSLPTSDTIECVGFYAGQCGSPNPEWRHIASANWNTPWDIGAQLTWRHFQGVSAEETVGAAAGSFDESLDSANFLDLGLTYSGIEDVKLRFGVNNILDSEPPLSSSVGAGVGNGNTYPTVYDALGRYLFGRATIDF